MKFEVYCDESCPEALFNKNAHDFSAIGGIWIPAEKRSDLKHLLKMLKLKYNVSGELKWQKVSPAFLELYKELIDLFFQTDFIRFRVVIIETALVDHIKFNNKDNELGFYKFYYQLLHHWIFDFNDYEIFVDLKVNREMSRLKTLRKVLNFSNLTSNINQVQGLPSDEVLGIQLADVLTGLVTAKFNNKTTSKAKLDLISHVENTYLKGRPIIPSPKWEEKLNVFKINLKGGW